MKMSANIIFNTWGLSSSSINFHLTLTSVKTMSVVSCKGHPPPTPHSPSLHLRTSEKRGVLHRMEVLSHLSHLQSPLPGQRGWSLVSNYPTILQPPAHGADPPPWYSITQYNSALGNRRIILLTWVQCIINGGEDNLALIWEMIVYVGCRLRC